MFIGHYAAAFAAKRAAPRLSLGLLVVAASLPDLLFAALVLAGVEVVRPAPGHTVVVPLEFPWYPYSHSLLAALVLGLLLAGLVAWRRPALAARATLVLVALVVSHWVLDVLSHAPDMPLYPGSATIGLGLWNSRAGTMAVEFALFVAGSLLYVRSTRAKDAIGRWALRLFMTALALIYIANVSIAGPPPGGLAFAIVGVAGGWLLVLWAWWADRHRAMTTGEMPATGRSPAGTVRRT